MCGVCVGVGVCVIIYSFSISQTDRAAPIVISDLDNDYI